MEQTKEWYESKGAWGGIVTAVIGILTMLGVGAVAGEEKSIVELIMQIVAIAGGITAFVGRIVAKKRIKPPGGVNMLLMLCVAGVLVMAVAGCNGVNMAPEYSALLNSTVAWSRVVADKAAAGEMTAEQKIEALEINADMWERFEDAKNGVGTEGGDR